MAPGPLHLAVGIIPARAGFTRFSTSSSPARPDHPRSRGVYPGFYADENVIAGSSPLARGLPPAGLPRPLTPGIIPARAGFTLLDSADRIIGPDHPRSRGVYSTGRFAGRLIQGSSPLARGLPCLTAHKLTLARIIPARAGFTQRRSGPRALRWDHPRSRGVYCRWAGRRGSSRGSSPLARGLRTGCSRPQRATRIIPARAGFTGRSAGFGFISGDHPRSRGVYKTHDAQHRNSPGSSPLARGLPPPTYYVTRTIRIIPARAGFTCPRLREHPISPDHPRSRGVYPRIGTHLASVVGSSPLARGLQTRARRIGSMERIIPARAGFTMSTFNSVFCVSDHPRSRGVYKTHDSPHTNSLGSSPLARGLRPPAGRRAPSRRIIPARAGFTFVA